MVNIYKERRCIVSTISTDEQDRNYQYAKERLEDLQRRILQAGADTNDLVAEINELRNQNPFTQSEFYRQQNEIEFKEKQINEIQKIVNINEARAKLVARSLDIIL